MVPTPTDPIPVTTTAVPSVVNPKVFAVPT